MVFYIHKNHEKATLGCLDCFWFNF